MAGKFYKKYFLLLGVVLFLILINHLAGGSVVGGVYGLFKQPGGYLQARLLGISQYSRGLLNLTQLLAEDEQVKSENIKLLSEAANVDRLQRDNQMLRAQLRVSVPAERQLLLTRVFALTSTPVAVTALIDKGSIEGLKLGQAVISGGNVLVGTIGGVFDHSAVVWLLADQRSTISVRINSTQSNSSQAIVGSWRGGGLGQVGKIELVTNQEAIQVDELLTTSGLDGLPEGLLVGRISQAELRGGNLFQSIQARPLADGLTSPTLFVITNHAD